MEIIKTKTAYIGFEHLIVGVKTEVTKIMSNDTSEIDADIQWYVDQCKMNNIAVDNYQLGRFVERVCINLNDEIPLDQARNNAFMSIFP